MLIFYNLFYILFVLVSWPALVLRGRWSKNMLMRFGAFSEDLALQCQAKDNIWVHAVSVGEVFAVTGLLKGLSKRYPLKQIVLSTVTKTGFSLAQSQLKDNGLVIYAPLDLPFTIDKYLHIINPQLYISAETEIWPNLFLRLRRRNIKILLINGRVSDISLGRYLKVKRLLAPILDCVGAFCMQSETDAERILAMGADTQRVRVTGNIKFDDVGQVQTFHRSDFGISDNDILLIAGSTHPGEEKILLNIYSRLKHECPPLRLLIAPRHIERTEEVESLVKSLSLIPLRCSQARHHGEVQSPVIIVDTIGQLRSLYSLSDIVFVGKSLAGRGGQNIIEPACFGNAILIGPHVENFQSIVDIFLKANALLQVEDEECLYEKIKDLAVNSRTRQELGSRAREVVTRNQGASSMTLNLIAEYLGP